MCLLFLIHKSCKLEETKSKLMKKVSPECTLMALINRRGASKLLTQTAQKHPSKETQIPKNTVLSLPVRFQGTMLCNVICIIRIAVYNKKISSWEQIKRPGATGVRETWKQVKGDVMRQSSLRW